MPANYDAWRTGPFGRFERDQERRDEIHVLALSKRDSELREDPNELAEALIDLDIDNPPAFARWLAILQAAAQHKPPREIGEAFTRLVQDIIDAEARRHAEEETR